MADTSPAVPSFTYSDFIEMHNRHVNEEIRKDEAALAVCRRMANIAELSIKRSIEKHGIEMASQPLNVIIPVLHTDVMRAMRLTGTVLESDGWRVAVEHAPTPLCYDKSLTRDQYQDSEVAIHFGAPAFFCIRVKFH